MNTNKPNVRIGAVCRSEDGEYSVPVYVNGTRSEAKTYYAADRADAVTTREAMLIHQRAADAVASVHADDARTVRKLVRHCAKIGATVTVCDRDAGPEPIDLTKPVEAAAEILACDESALRIEVDGRRCGIFLVFGNGDDTTVTDYTDNAMARSIVAATEGGAS
jgi:hypothetical protein